MNGDEAIAAWNRRAARAEVRPAPVVEEACKHCEGNGEIVTDWDVYLHPPKGAEADAGTATCPDCDGRGLVEVARPAVDREGEPSEDFIRLVAEAMGARTGYSISLTRLVDGVETYTLSMDGYEPQDFDDRDEAAEVLHQRLNRDRAKRLLALLSPATSPGEGSSGAAVGVLHDKIEGLEEELFSAVKVAYQRGAVEWTRLNYPAWFERFRVGGGQPPAEARPAVDREAVARVVAVCEAAQVYYERYCQDEAADDGPDFTGCSEQQHLDAQHLRDALAEYSRDEILALLSPETSPGEGEGRPDDAGGGG